MDLKKSTPNLSYFWTKIRRRIFMIRTISCKKSRPKIKNADAQNPMSGNEAELDAEMWLTEGRELLTHIAKLNSGYVNIQKCLLRHDVRSSTHVGDVGFLSSTHVEEILFDADKMPHSRGAALEGACPTHVEHGIEIQLRSDTGVTHRKWTICW